MTKKTLCLIGTCILLGIFVFTACDAFYSTSWGTAREYDPANIDLNSGNLDRWVDTAIGNPKLAKALAQKIKDKVGGMGNAERARFQSAGVELVFEASGLGNNLLSNIDKAVDMMDASDGGGEIDKALMDMLNATLAGFDPSVADILAAIMQPSFKGNPPEFSQGFKSATSASDVGKAAIILILATIADTNKLKDGFREKFVIDVNEPGGNIFKCNPGADLKDQALAAYLNLISSDTSKKFDNNPITESLNEIIGQIKRDL